MMEEWNKQRTEDGRFKVKGKRNKGLRAED
jgi:hypothetical protein